MWFSIFLENALVRRVKRRIDIGNAEIGALHVGCADVLRIGRAVHFDLVATDARCGAIAGAVGTLDAIDFVENRVVDVVSKRIVHGVHVIVLGRPW